MMARQSAIEGRRDKVELLIERMHELTPEEMRDLLSESEQAGFRFIRRLVEEWVDGINRFDRPGEALFGARARGQLVGICGLNVDPYAADPLVGRVRHLYVLSLYRRRGVGRRLVAAVVEAAQDRSHTLRLRTRNPGAALFYEALGFQPSGAADSTHSLRLDTGTG